TYSTHTQTLYTHTHTHILYTHTYTHTYCIHTQTLYTHTHTHTHTYTHVPILVPSQAHMCMTSQGSASQRGLADKRGVYPLKKKKWPHQMTVPALKNKESILVPPCPTSSL